MVAKKGVILLDAKTIEKLEFENIYVLDTNIILNDHANVEILSQSSSNLVVIPETVLDELDSKKSGFDEINSQARAFGRLLDSGKMISVENKNDMTVVRYFINSDKNITIDIISKEKYDIDVSNVPANIVNDRKIIDIAKSFSSLYDNVTFMSNDVMCKIRAISLGVKSDSLHLNMDSEVILNWKLSLDEAQNEYNIFDIEAMDVPTTVQGLEIEDSRGVSSFYYKTGSVFRMIDENEIKRQEISPKNIGQKTLTSMMLDPYYDIVLVDAPAGSGKTLIALSAAMRLLDTHKDKYDKIVYIRKTVVSNSEELGFLPGSLEEKMSGYLAPLYSNLEYIVDKKYNQKKDKLTEEEKSEKIDQMIKRYGIKAMYQGHLRGDNIRNAIIIYDENQNDSVADAKTTLTRVADNCKAFILGSNRQIDSKYVNKHNNSLTYIKNRIGKDNMNVNLTGFRLDKTVRSNIAEWADTF